MSDPITYLCIRTGTARKAGLHSTGTLSYAILKDADATEAWQTNLAALQYGQRIVSAYAIAPDVVIWIITEADRSASTLLLPSEY